MRSDTDPRHRAAVAQAIQRGAQLIRLRGWCVGALGDDSGRVCLMGAIRLAAQDETRLVRYDAYDEVNQALRRGPTGLHDWNDEQTDGERVAQLLEAVAKKVDPRLPAIEICWHGHPVCPDCKSAIGCYADDWKHRRSDGQHERDCEAKATLSATQGVAVGGRKAGHDDSVGNLGSAA